MRAKTYVAWTLCLVAVSLQADLVVMQNGDRYSGKVVSVSDGALVLQSENLGRVNLSREKVANILFATNATPVTPAVAPASPSPTATASTSATNAASPIDAHLQQLTTQTNLARRVAERFLAGASPEAAEDFNRMLDDLATGKMTMADLRTKAKEAVEQLRALQRDAGGDSSGTMSMYLSILDHFLQESATPKDATTNSTNTPAK